MAIVNSSIILPTKYTVLRAYSHEIKRAAKTPSPRQTHILPGKEAVEVDSRREGILWRTYECICETFSITGLR